MYQEEEEAEGDAAAEGGWADVDGIAGSRATVDAEEDLDLDAMDAMAQDTLSKVGAGGAPAMRASTPPPAKSAKRKASEGGGASEERKKVRRDRTLHLC